MIRRLCMQAMTEGEALQFFLPLLNILYDDVSFSAHSQFALCR